jgi:hypothetical protein
MASRAVNDESASALARIDYRPDPCVLIIADSPETEEAWRRAALLAGCRISGCASIADGAARIDRQLAVDSVLVGLSKDPDAGSDEALDAILRRIATAAAAGRHGSAVAAPAALIDRIAAASFHPGIQHLVDPTDVERATALAVSTTRQPPRLHDVVKGSATARLQQLSEEVGRVATILAALSEDEAAATALAGRESEENIGERIESGQVRAIIRARRLRDHFFKSDLFADPAWDMMLDLMAARIEGQKVAVSSLCIAAAVPPTTALRWIKALCDQGIFVRLADPEDGRRVFIELADPTAAALDAYLRAAQRIAPLNV